MTPDNVPLNSRVCESIEDRKSRFERMRVEGLAMTPPRCAQAVSRGVTSCNDCCICLSSHPAGKTCNDCYHASRCKALFGTKGSETYCQFIPKRSQFAAEISGSDTGDPT